MGDIEDFEQIELTFDLNTGAGQNAIITDKIIGKLDCVIVKCDVPVDVIIDSTIGYNILKRACKKTEYILPRHKVQEPVENLMGGLQLDRFNLNETLDIMIMGPANTDIKLIFRFC